MQSQQLHIVPEEASPLKADGNLNLSGLTSIYLQT